MESPQELFSIEQRIDELIASNLSPLDLLPPALGLEWGMLKEETLGLLGDKVQWLEAGIQRKLPNIQKDNYLVELAFEGDYESFNRLLSHPYYEESFQETNFNELHFEERVSLIEYHFKQYSRLKQYYITLLGQPSEIEEKEPASPEFERIFPYVPTRSKVKWNLNNSIITLQYEQQFHWGGRSWIRLELQPEFPICHFEEFDNIKLLPTHILPSKLGINWDNIKDNIPQAYSDSKTWTRIQISVENQTYDLILFFDDKTKKLHSIMTCLYFSRLFFEHYDYDEMDQVETLVEERYGQYVNKCVTVLGEPHYSGIYDRFVENPFNTKWSAIYTNIWLHDEGRLHLDFVHEDKELPFQIQVAWYPLTEELTEKLVKYRH